ncbi:unnamed protein product, partial [Ectocarpus sp. 12 AP-2014]
SALVAHYRAGYGAAPILPPRDSGVRVNAGKQGWSRHKRLRCRKPHTAVGIVQKGGLPTNLFAFRRHLQHQFCSCAVWYIMCYQQRGATQNVTAAQDDREAEPTPRAQNPKTRV